VKAGIEGHVVYVAEGIEISRVHEILATRNIAFPKKARMIVIRKRDKRPAIILE